VGCNQGILVKDAISKLVADDTALIAHVLSDRTPHPPSQQFWRVVASTAAQAAATAAATAAGRRGCCVPRGRVPKVHSGFMRCWRSKTGLDRCGGVGVAGLSWGCGVEYGVAWSCLIAGCAHGVRPSLQTPGFLTPFRTQQKPPNPTPLSLPPYRHQPTTYPRPPFMTTNPSASMTPPPLSTPTPSIITPTPQGASWRCSPP